MGARGAKLNAGLFTRAEFADKLGRLYFNGAEDAIKAPRGAGHKVGQRPIGRETGAKGEVGAVEEGAGGCA